MRDAYRVVRGVRLRRTVGGYSCVPSSRNGVFLPGTHVAGDQPTLLTEGATDTAAALALGFAAIGRPSTNSGAAIVRALVHGGDVVVVADSDGPGADGAERLAFELVPFVRTVRTIAPPSPFKDLRDWLCGGGTALDLTALITATPEQRVRVSRR